MEPQRLALSQAIIFTVITGLLMFFLRAFPFLVFSRKKPPEMLNFIEKFIPAMVIGVLIIYCLADPKYFPFLHTPWHLENLFGKAEYFTSFLKNLTMCLPAIAGICSTIILHLWKNNSMISIFGGTIIYMVLQRFLPVFIS